MRSRLTLSLILPLASLIAASAHAVPISYLGSEADLLATADAFRIEPPDATDSDADPSQASDVTVWSDSVSASANVPSGSAFGAADLDVAFAGSTVFADGSAFGSFFEPGEAGGDGYGRSYFEITFSTDREVRYSLDGSLVADAPFGGSAFASVILEDEFGGVVFDQTIDGIPDAFLDFTENGTLAVGTYSLFFEAIVWAPDGAPSASFLVSGTIPEPSTASLLGLGLVGMTAVRRRRAAALRSDPTREVAAATSDGRGDRASGARKPGERVRAAAGELPLRGAAARRGSCRSCGQRARRQSPLQLLGPVRR